MSYETKSGTSRSWIRVFIVPVLVLGVLALHSVLASDSQAGDRHGELTPGAAVTVAVADVMDTVVDPSGGEPGPWSDCEGLMALCIAMLVGAGVHLWMRRGRSQRVLWTIPPPNTYTVGFAAAPVQHLTPLQRTSVSRR